MLSHHIYNIYTAMCIICKFSQNTWINIFTHVIITSVLKFLITPKFLDILELFSHCFKGLCFTSSQILICFFEKIYEALSSENYHYSFISLRTKESPKRKPLGNTYLKLLMNLCYGSGLEIIPAFLLFQRICCEKSSDNICNTFWVLGRNSVF